MNKVGFTLIELSIVLVIIALVVGGVMVGRDLIEASRIRQQVSQIGEISASVNAFRLKYNHLPGDIPASAASAAGFVARGTNVGEGDGNGNIQGTTGSASTLGYVVANGEAAMFWVDLFTAGLSPYRLTIAVPTIVGGNKAVSDYLPSAKIGVSNAIYVWNTGGINYFGMAGGSTGAIFIGGFYAGQLVNNSTSYGTPLTVQQAYTLDSKMDDGFPQTGRVSARYVFTNAVYWAAGGAAGASGTAATPSSATTCYDNNNVSGAVQIYSTAVDSGNGINCSLSFRF